MQKCFIRTLEITDKKLFGTSETIPCTCHCFDGFAICYPLPGDDDLKLPTLFFMSYPTLKEVRREKMDYEILAYQMGYDAKGLKVKDYGDVCLYCGVPSLTLNVPLGSIGKGEKIKFIDEQ